MRHAREVSNVIQSIDGLAEREHEFRVRFLKVARLDHFAQHDVVTLLIGYYECNIRFTRHTVYLDEFGFECQTKVIS